MVPDMALSANMVTIDCVDPGSLAQFWTQALGYRIRHDFQANTCCSAPPSRPPR